MSCTDAWVITVRRAHSPGVGCCEGGYNESDPSSCGGAGLAYAQRPRKPLRSVLLLAIAFAVFLTNQPSPIVSVVEARVLPKTNQSVSGLDAVTISTGPRTVTTSRFFVDWSNSNPNNPEEITVINWPNPQSGANLTAGATPPPTLAWRSIKRARARPMLTWPAFTGTPRRSPCLFQKMLKSRLQATPTQAMILPENALTPSRL